MPPIFHRRADNFLRASLISAGLVAGALAAFVLMLARSAYATGVNQPVAQPVEFSHRLHVSSIGLDCFYCHTTAADLAYAGMPSTATCMNCHSQIWTDSPLLTLVRRSYENDVPIAWNRVHDLPDFTYFDHSAHVANGFGCEDCHGRVDLMSGIWKAESLQMSWCLDCHRHPEQYVRPRDQVLTMGYTPAQPQEVLGPQLVAEYGLQERVDCTICHR